MASKLETIVLDNMSHPAYRRFKELYEPLGLRKEERAQRFRKVRLFCAKYSTDLTLSCSLVST